MRSSKLCCCILILFSLVMGAQTCLAGPSTHSFHAIAYHNIVEDRSELGSDDMTVETLVNHFEWLLANGYHPVSIETILEVAGGHGSLPEKSVLLCWDDGYTSFFTHVFPLLKAYGFPAVLALVGDWMDVEEDGQVRYGGELVAREEFLSPVQLRALAASPLVELASHSYDLHKGMLADSAGDMLPAVITHVYDPGSGRYETDAEMHQRLAIDLKRNSAYIEEMTGIRPRVMVWPFGRYNQLSVKAAHESGIEMMLTLDPVIASTDLLDAVPRIYPTLNVETGAFKGYFLERNRAPLRRFITVRSEDLLEEPDNNEKVFGQFLDRTKQLAPARLYMEPVVKTEGTVKALFRNTSLPVARDRLLRFCWHTDRRAGSEVHLELTESLLRQVEPTQWGALFDAMGKSAPGSGLLLADHALALQVMQEIEFKHFDLLSAPWNPVTTRKNRKQMKGEAANKEVALFLGALEEFQQWQPFQDMGILLQIEAFLQLSMSSASSLLHYFDYVMVDLQGTVPDDLDHHPVLAGELSSHFVFRLDYKKAQQEDKLVGQLEKLMKLGITDYGYGYDRFIQQQPSLQRVQPYVSARTYPFIPR